MRRFLSYLFWFLVLHRNLRRREYHPKTRCPICVAPTPERIVTPKHTKSRATALSKALRKRPPKRICVLTTTNLPANPSRDGQEENQVEEPESRSRVRFTLSTQMVLNPLPLMGSSPETLFGLTFRDE